MFRALELSDRIAAVVTPVTVESAGGLSYEVDTVVDGVTIKLYREDAMVAALAASTFVRFVDPTYREDDDLAAVITRIKSYTAHQLSGDADCASPDSPTSAGAHFLTNVRDNVVERVEGFDADDLEALRSEVGTVQDVVSEIADEAPNVYTYTLWAQFVDLAAYNEDPTELGANGSDMEGSARVCLYLVAERLAQALFTEIHEALREA
jgi:hypothetical protein